MSSRSRAPVESMTRGSSCGTNGRVTGSEPAAMIAESNETVVVDPSGPVTLTMFGEVKVPVPTRVWTLRCLARPVSPPVSRVTTLSFHARSASRSMVGEANASPAWLISLVSAMTLAACSRALEGMQPTLRQTPPSGPRESIMTTLLAEVGGAERGGVAAGPGAQHEYLGVQVTFLPGVGGRCAHCHRLPLRGGRPGRRPVARRRRQLLVEHGLWLASGAGLEDAAPPSRRAGGGGRGVGHRWLPGR